MGKRWASASSFDGRGIVVSAHDYQALAERVIGPDLCGYIGGGAGDEATVKGNVAAFADWWFRPRGLVDVSHVGTQTTVLGVGLSTPVLVAPLAFQRAIHPDGEVACALGARQQGTIMCLSTFGSASPSEVKDVAPGLNLWQQIYLLRDRGLVYSLIESADAAGAKALVLTIDAPLLGRRERDLRSGFKVDASLPIPGIRGKAKRAVSPEVLFGMVDPGITWGWLEELVDISRLPVVVKGVLTAEDAHLACEHGASAIVVSNHGGRQLDGAIPSLDALPGVVERVGERAEVYLDGGIRRGTDVAKALALGARAVFVGRPVLWALATQGQAGVSDVLAMITDELAAALALLGCPSVDHLSSSHVVRSMR